MFDLFSSIINILLFILHWIIGHYRHMSGRNLKRKLSFSGQPKSRWQSVMKPGVSIPGRSMGMLTTGRGVQRYGTHLPELKFVDLAKQTFTMTQSGTGSTTGLNLFQTIQGGAGYQRIGQRVQLKSLRIRGNLEGITAYTGVETGRFLVVYDRQANGANAKWEDVISSVTAAGASSSTELDSMNLANRERFDILIDEQLYLPGFQITAGVVASTTSLFGSTDKNPTMFNIDRFVNLKNREVHFNNTNGGSIADIQTGSLQFFLVSSSVAQAKWTMDFTARIRFQDI